MAARCAPIAEPASLTQQPSALASYVAGLRRRPLACRETVDTGFPGGAATQRSHTGLVIAQLFRQGGRMKRRSVIAALAGLLVASERPLAQQVPAKIPGVGILAPAESDKTAFFDAFRAGLRELGYVEGRNIILEFRLAHFDYTLLPGLAQKLVDLPVDVLVASGGPTARIAMEATREIPIITIGVDPALFGRVGSLARPRVNVTGFTLMTPELTAKRLEVLRSALPNITAVAVLLNTANPSSKAYWQTTEEAAWSFGLPIVARVEAESVEALLALRPTAFTDAGAVVVMQDGLFWNHRRDVLALVNSARLPAIYAEREFADDGGLIAYGPNISDNFRRSQDKSFVIKPS
jgi:putative ABC transport system substrate-binding protein